MPTGIVAQFGSPVSEQNALPLSMLLSPWEGIKIGHDEIVKLPTYFSQDCIPVTHGMPPATILPSPPQRDGSLIPRLDMDDMPSLHGVPTAGVIPSPC